MNVLAAWKKNWKIWILAISLAVLLWFYVTHFN